MIKFVHFSLLVLLNAVLIGDVFASETLFHIVRKGDWLIYADKSGYHPPSLEKEGFIHLSTREQVCQVAKTFFPGEKDLLLLKIEISSADPLLKWENVPGSEASFPHYYGALPRTFIKEIYPFEPQQDGSFTLPKDPFWKRIAAHAVPGVLVSKLLHYQRWQKTNRFHRLEVDNFVKPKVQSQWWYFDFFLEDGSTVVLAFIPQLWWNEDDPASKKMSHEKVSHEKVSHEKISLFMMSLRTSQGEVKRFSVNIPQSEIKTSSDHLEIPSRLLIQSSGSGNDRKYTIRVHFPEVTGVFEITPTRPPFAAFPTGVMPGIFGTVLSGAPVGSPRFSYVSQIPNGTLSGSLAWEEYQTQVRGQAYHEQGRQNDAPEHQGGYWTWYHFAGEGWNIFGSPGSYIYLQKGDQVLRSGFHLIARDYEILNRTLASPDHAKIVTGGEIHFRHQDLSFQLKLSPSTSKTLVSFPSPDPNQVWGTVEGPAELSIVEGSEKKTLKGRMILESCSWEKSKVYPSKKAKPRDSIAENQKAASGVTGSF